MEASRSTTLHLLCGKIAAGKSTLARRLASRRGHLLIAMDHWMSTLFPVENSTIEDFARLSARLRDAMGPHVVDILASEAHELHFLDVPDATCKERLRQRNISGDHPYQVDEPTYDLFMRTFVPPASHEGFNVIVHSSDLPPA